MPGEAEHVKIPESPMRKRSSTESEAVEVQSEEVARETDRSAVIEKLKAQGAVRVFPVSSRPRSNDGADAPLAESEASETESVSDGDVASSPDRESEHQAYLDRTQKMVDDANNPAWYDLPQHVENLRHGKWDLTQRRSRSGGRPQDYSVEEDIRTHNIIKKMDPGMFDISQKAKNAYDEARNNPLQTAAGLLPVFGSAIKQGMSERTDVRERDLLRGVATTESDAPVREGATTQADALATKITSGRVKAGISTVTGGVGKLMPGIGQVGMAVEQTANFAVDKLSAGSTKQVTAMRAREQARMDMGESEFGGYEGVGEFIALEKMRKQLEAAGGGEEDSGAASMISPDMLKRLKAHTRGQIPNAKEYQKRAKEVEKEREAERQRGMEPKPEGEKTGILSKMKRFFRRPS